MKNFVKEFKEFILKGNLIEIAVAFILATFFALVVTSFTNMILAFIGAIFGKPNFDALTFNVGDGVIEYGKFLTAVVNFVIVAFILFLVVKAYNAAKATMGKGEEEEEATEIELLTEIRDALRSRT